MTDPSGSSLTANVALQASSRAVARGRRMRLETRAVLVAVCALVFLVSLPRLRGIAIRENELDALRALELLSAEVEAAAARGAEPTRIAELCPADSLLLRRLSDVESLAGGRLVLRHGYLFELAESAGGEPVLCAWPWRRGSTGIASFAALPGAGVFGHGSEPEGGPAQWSGLGRPPRLDEVQPSALVGPASGWRRIRLPGTRKESY